MDDLPEEDEEIGLSADWIQHGNEGIADYSRAPLAGTLPADCAGLRLDAALARLFSEHSRSRLARWIAQGLVRIDARSASDGRRKVAGGEHIEILLAEEARTPEHLAESIALDIVFEDDFILVVNKPAGLVVHPGNGNESGTLMNALLHHAPTLAGLERAGIVHRLDKDTTGLMVVAKTASAQTALVRQLAARSVSRLYQALAHGRIERAGTVDAPLGRHPQQRTKIAVLKHGREARTHYRPLEHFATATLLECRLETGRTHQIRVHLASIGHPLVGDPVYGRKQTPDGRLAAFRRQALHAWQLALIHPQSGAAMSWQAPLPADFAHLLAILRDDRFVAA